MDLQGNAPGLPPPDPAMVEAWSVLLGSRQVRGHTPANSRGVAQVKERLQQEEDAATERAEAKRAELGKILKELFGNRHPPGGRRA